MGKSKNHKQPSQPQKTHIEPIVEEIVEEVEEVVEEVEVLPEPEIKFPTYTIKQAGVVTAHALNVRKSCSTDSDILKVLRKGDDVEILDENAANGWLPVLLADGTKGYCMSKFIK